MFWNSSGPVFSEGFDELSHAFKALWFDGFPFLVHKFGEGGIDLNTGSIFVVASIFVDFAKGSAVVLDVGCLINIGFFLKTFEKASFHFLKLMHKLK